MRRSLIAFLVSHVLYNFLTITEDILFISMGDWTVLITLAKLTRTESETLMPCVKAMILESHLQILAGIS